MNKTTLTELETFIANTSREDLHKIPTKVLRNMYAELTGHDDIFPKSVKKSDVADELKGYVRARKRGIAFANM